VLYADILHDIGQEFPPETPFNWHLLRHMHEQLANLHSEDAASDHA
jgi:hypothetical protein